jgi:hypothetical protein
LTISHDAIPHLDDKPIVFAALGGFTCSICAPNSMIKKEIEAYAATQFPGVWESIDKSQLKMGSPTPNPCNQDSNRTHWFMMWVDAPR